MVIRLLKIMKEGGKVVEKEISRLSNSCAKTCEQAAKERAKFFSITDLKALYAIEMWNGGSGPTWINRKVYIDGQQVN